jgi:malonyl-CoA decarboxylase
MGAELARLDARALRELGRAVGFEPPAAEHLLAALDKPLGLDPKSPLRRFLMGAAARYLGDQWQEGKPLDPVARFHLGNGARVERLNWAGDPSPKGLKQSYGLMVNYLYDLKRLDRHRAQLAQGHIPMSGEVEALLKA